jgi:hypothetical protein
MGSQGEAEDQEGPPSPGKPGRKDGKGPKPAQRAARRSGASGEPSQAAAQQGAMNPGGARPMQGGGGSRV